MFHYHYFFNNIHERVKVVVLSTWSLIRRKGESQNGGNKKTKYTTFSEKRTFLNPPPPPLTCTCSFAYQGVRIVCFFRGIWRSLFSCYLRCFLVGNPVSDVSRSILGIPLPIKKFSRRDCNATRSSMIKCCW